MEPTANADWISTFAARMRDDPAAVTAFRRMTGDARAHTGESVSARIGQDLVWRNRFVALLELRSKPSHVRRPDGEELGGMAALKPIFLTDKSLPDDHVGLWLGLVVLRTDVAKAVGLIRLVSAKKRLRELRNIRSLLRRQSTLLAGLSQLELEEIVPSFEGVLCDALDRVRDARDDLARVDAALSEVDASISEQRRLVRSRDKEKAATAVQARFWRPIDRQLEVAGWTHAAIADLAEKSHSIFRTPPLPPKLAGEALVEWLRDRRAATKNWLSRSV